MRATAIFYLFWFRSYGLFKVHYCMVVVRFGPLEGALLLDLRNTDLFTLVGSNWSTLDSNWPTRGLTWGANGSSQGSNWSTWGSNGLGA